MITITDPSDCCGCTACASICAHDAIKMKPDSLGFLYPEVDHNRCVECGLCEKVCSFNPNYDKSQNFLEPKVYGVRHKDMREVETSRSGAAFVAISDYNIEHGGVVYGAGYKDHFRVCHKRATTKKDCSEFKGSKYVQSDLTGVFCQVKQDLKDGLIVLFSGTPCQTAGLNSFVGMGLRKNLLLVDIVCHGVPGPFLWRDYIAYLEEKQGDEIVRVNFRDKQRFGWKAHRESFKFKLGGGKTVIFSSLFYKQIMFRHSCAKCYYTNTTRPSDITLADFWGWEKSNPEINKDDKGVSLVFLNTEKGQKLWEQVQNDCITFPVKLEDAMQHNLKAPTKIHQKRMLFEEDYKKYGFKFIIKKYEKGKVVLLTHRIKRIIENFIKRLLK